MSCRACRYFITGGSKFGADYLVYPGDPSLYHAQYCVRVVEPSTCFSPALLAGAARGSHAARKHLLLATVKQVMTVHWAALEMRAATEAITKRSPVGAGSVWRSALYLRLSDHCA